MRLVFISCLLFAYSAFSTSVKLESNGFGLEISLLRSADNSLMGTATIGECEGNYAYDSANSLFVAEFQSSEECSKNSVEADISKEEVKLLAQGKPVGIVFRSAQFYMREMKGTIRLVPVTAIN
jgi:hypothetical protein